MKKCCKPVQIEDLWEIEDVWPKKEGEIMLNTQNKRDIIYALEEWTKALEREGNIAKRNEIMELTWKVSAIGQKAYQLEGESE